MRRAAGLLGLLMAVSLLAQATAAFAMSGPSTGPTSVRPPAAVKAASVVGDTTPGDWPMYTHDALGSGNAAAETIISPANAPSVAAKWVYQASYPVLSQPVVVNGEVYIDDDSGFVKALSVATGALLWSTAVGQTTPSNGGAYIQGPVSTGNFATMPVNGVATHVLFVGGGYGGLYALNADTGAVIWMNQITDPLQGGFAWTSPLLYNDALYMGVASEADKPLNPGQFLKIDALTGATLVTMTISPPGCVGGGIWGSPSIDPTLGRVYVATGTEKACSTAAPVLEQSVVAFDAVSLAVVDFWHLPENQQGTGDADFGSVPTIFDAPTPGTSGHLLAVASKNGLLYGLDRTNLAAGPVWSTRVSIAGADPVNGGGTIAPAAYDGQRLYIAGGNLTVGGTLCQTALIAVDPPTGNVVWRNCFSDSTDGAVVAPVSVANGVVYLDEGAYMVGAAASNGATLFKYQPGLTTSKVLGGPTISNGVVYAGDNHWHLTALAPTQTATPAPRVTSLSPTWGPAAGGTSVVISGRNLTPAMSVIFGGAAGTVTASSPTSLTVTAPPGVSGTVDVQVSTPGGTTPRVPADRYTYLGQPTPPPAITGLSPTSGPTAGGNSVVISGTNLTPATSVVFGAAAATVTAFSATSITVRAPAGASGIVDVQVRTPAGTSPLVSLDRYTYTVPTSPAVTAVSPASGSVNGGTVVTVSGSNLTPVSTVFFGSAAATVNASSPTSLTVVTGPHVTKTVDVRVTTPAGITPIVVADQFRYQALVTPVPAVTSLSPSTGPLGGGTSVVISGSNLTPVSSVTFGGVAATVNASSPTSLTVSNPTHAAATVDVVVTTPSGSSPVAAGNRFTYQGPPPPPAPSVTVVSPPAGPSGGGTSVVISGSNLTPVSSVTFGGVAATVNASSPTSLTVSSPAYAAATVDVVVTTPSGSSPVVAGDRFTYQGPPPPPAVSGISPLTGPPTGGTSVTISGSNLTPVSSVTIGGVTASVAASSPTSVMVSAPAHVAGTVDVVVTTPAGSSAVVAGDRFTYQAGPPPPPAITAVSPPVGSIDGGTSVTISGSNLTPVSSVTIGNTGATLTASSPTSLTITTWPHVTNTMDVRVRTPSGISPVVAADHYRYQVLTAGPSIAGITPSSGAGAMSVTILGYNLTPVSSVTFGGVATTPSSMSSTSLTVSAPPHAPGLVDVVVTTPLGTSPIVAADRFTYVAGPPAPPSVSSVSPSNGTPAGGTAVTITGSNFVGVTGVRFGSVAAPSFTVVSPTMISATAPAGATMPMAATTVDVVVTNVTGSSATGVFDEFTSTFSNGGYAISLAATTTTAAVGASVAFTATANQDIGATPYGLSIFDATTGAELVHAAAGTTVTTSVAQTSATTHRYVASVCDLGGVNVVATSIPVVVGWQ